MRNSASLMIRGDKLQPELSAALDGSEPGALYEVRIHRVSPEDAAYFFETRAQAQEGVADIEAGNVVGEEEAFAEIQRLIASKSIG